MTQGLTDWLQHNRLTVIGVDKERGRIRVRAHDDACSDITCGDSLLVAGEGSDRKSTRLNCSHSSISYAVFCLKKKKHKYLFRIFKKKKIILHISEVYYIIK